MGILWRMYLSSLYTWFDCVSELHGSISDFVDIAKRTHPALQHCDHRFFVGRQTLKAVAYKLGNFDETRSVLIYNPTMPNPRAISRLDSFDLLDFDSDYIPAVAGSAQLSILWLSHASPDTPAPEGHTDSIYRCSFMLMPCSRRAGQE